MGTKKQIYNGNIWTINELLSRDVNSAQRENFNSH